MYVRRAIRPMSRVLGWRNVLEIRPGAGAAPERLSVRISVGLSAGAVAVLMGLSLGDIKLGPCLPRPRFGCCSLVPAVDGNDETAVSI